MKKTIHDCGSCKWFNLPDFEDDGDCVTPCHDCGFGEGDNEYWEKPDGN